VFSRVIRGGAAAILATGFLAGMPASHALAATACSDSATGTSHTVDVGVGTSHIFKDVDTGSGSTTKIGVGDSVLWTWSADDSGTQHSTTENSGSPVWNSDIHVPPHSCTHSFPSAGLFSYHCQVHSNMTGTVIVGTVFRLSAANYSVNESGGMVTITIQRFGDTSGTNDVDYATSDGTATAGTDYTDTHSTMTFNPSDTSHTVDVPILDDNVTGEGDSHFAFTLSNATSANGAVLGSPKTATVTIHENDPVYRPDAQIRTSSSSTWAGNNVYNTTGVGQTKLLKEPGGHAATFYERVQNDGTGAADAFRLKGAGSTTKFSVKYFVGTTNVTSGVVAGTYRTGSVAPGGFSKVLKIVITPKRAARAGDLEADLITATSTHTSTKKDAVKAKVKALS